MTVSTAMENWLEDMMLDEDRLKLAIADVEQAMQGYDFSDDERDFLKNPEQVVSTFLMRPMIIRNINSFNKENTSMIARFPDQYRELMKIVARAGGQKSRSAEASMEQVAHEMIDSIHVEADPQDEYKLPTADKCDIRIVGLGMRSVDQLTREARRAIQGCTTLYVVDSSPGIQSYFTALGLEVVDLSRHYAEGKDRLQTYLEMSKEVISGAINKGPVSFGLYGHPTVFAYPPFVIKAVAESFGLTVGVVPGVSALDCMLAELMIDPATDGMQMFEATDIVIRKRTLLVDVHTLIWQIGALETGLYSKNPSTPGRFDRFLDHIAGFFPVHHPVSAIFVSDNPLIPSIIYRFKLKDLPEYGDRLHGGFTLHIPPLLTAPVRDYEALDLLKSREHLEAITVREASPG